MIPPCGMSLEIILPPTVPFTVKSFKLKDDMHNCVILCVAATTKRLPVWCMKSGFSPSEVGGIACCGHKMSSASSLSPYQAVYCTELSPLALGAGHTSWHPPTPPTPSPLFLSLSLSSSVCLSFSFSFYKGAVTHPSSQPSLSSLSPWGAQLP